MEVPVPCSVSTYGEVRMRTVGQDGVLWCHSLLCGRSLHCEVESVHCRGMLGYCVPALRIGEFFVCCRTNLDIVKWYLLG